MAKATVKHKAHEDVARVRWSNEEAHETA